MKALLQRVAAGSVTVNGTEVGRIGPGLVVFLGVARDDSAEDADYLARRVAGLRVFPREDQEFDLSVQDVGGGVLVVSQFTLMADTRKGRRPGFSDAAPPSDALLLYERFIAALAAQGISVATGAFQQHMHVSIVNDGPVTVLLESRRI